MKTLVSLATLLILSIFIQTQERKEEITTNVTFLNITSSASEIIFGLYNENTVIKTDYYKK